MPRHYWDVVPPSIPSKEGLSRRVRPCHGADMLGKTGHSSVPSLAFAVLILVSITLPTLVWPQVPTVGERFSLVLSGDPFKWEQILNEAGEKGWDALMAQQPAVHGLVLHFVVFARTPAIKSVDYKVIVAEFPAEDVSSKEIARSQLEVQANAYGRNGWAVLQALTGQHTGGKPFIALILKKPIL